MNKMKRIPLILQIAILFGFFAYYGCQLYEAYCWSRYNPRDIPGEIWVSQDPAGWLSMHSEDDSGSYGVLRLNGTDTAVSFGGTGNRYCSMLQYSKEPTILDMYLFSGNCRFRRDYFKMNVKPEDDLGHFFGGKKKVITFTRQTVDKMPPLP